MMDQNRDGIIDESDLAAIFQQTGKPVQPHMATHTATVTNRVQYLFIYCIPLFCLFYFISFIFVYFVCFIGVCSFILSVKILLFYKYRDNCSALQSFPLLPLVCMNTCLSTLDSTDISIKFDLFHMHAHITYRTYIFQLKT